MLKISQIEKNNKINVFIEFYKKERENWKLIQAQYLSKESNIPLLTEMNDFNNDGFLDFTIHYSTAGRGANDLRKLFIFKPERNNFIEIINSDNYSNLSYNSRLDCITSLSVYGGSTTHFLKLENDMLNEFAQVSYNNGKVSSYKVKNDSLNLLFEINYDSDNEMILFKNYDPIEE